MKIQGCCDTILLASAFLLAATQSFAQVPLKYPTKPVRFVVNQSAGSSPDITARAIARKLSDAWGQPVIVDNRPGAGGVLAANTVAKATPDGYTLLYAVGFSLSAALQPTLPYDPIKDFAGVTQTTIGSNVLAAAPALGVKSVQELIALAKSQPGKLIYSTGGAGTPSHLQGESLRITAGIKVVNVKFNAGVDALIETLGGRTHYCFAGIPVALPYIKEKKVIALAVTATQRVSVLPDVPTLIEVLPQIKRADSSTGLQAPAKTPRIILVQISKEVARILDLPEVKERLISEGSKPAPTTPEEYDRILREQIESTARLASDIGLRAK